MWHRVRHSSAVNASKLSDSINQNTRCAYNAHYKNTYFMLQRVRENERSAPVSVYMFVGEWARALVMALCVEIAKGLVHHFHDTIESWVSTKWVFYIIIRLIFTCNVHDLDLAPIRWRCNFWHASVDCLPPMFRVMWSFHIKTGNNLYLLSLLIWSFSFHYIDKRWK